MQLHQLPTRGQPLPFFQDFFFFVNIFLMYWGPIYQSALKLKNILPIFHIISLFLSLSLSVDESCFFLLYIPVVFPFHLNRLLSRISIAICVDLC